MEYAYFLRHLRDCWLWGDWKIGRLKWLCHRGGRRDGLFWWMSGRSHKRRRRTMMYQHSALDCETGKPPRPILLRPNEPSTWNAYRSAQTGINNKSTTLHLSPRIQTLSPRPTNQLILQSNTWLKHNLKHYLQTCINKYEPTGNMYRSLKTIINNKSNQRGTRILQIHNDLSIKNHYEICINNDSIKISVE